MLRKNKGRIVFNGKFIFMDDIIFNDVDREEWKDFYHDAHDEMPIYMPKPLGNPARLIAYVDANHAGNLKTIRYHSDIFVYMNQAPIIVEHSRSFKLRIRIYRFENLY